MPLNILLSVLPLVATILLCLAGFVFFFNRNRTFAEASSYAVMAMLMGWSLLIQVALLFGIPAIVPVLQGAVVLTVPFLLYRNRHRFSRALSPLHDFINAQKMISFIFCLGALALMLSGFFLSHKPGWLTTAACPYSPPLWPVLNHWVLSHPQIISPAGVKDSFCSLFF